MGGSLEGPVSISSSAVLNDMREDPGTDGSNRSTTSGVRWFQVHRNQAHMLPPLSATAAGAAAEAESDVAILVDGRNAGPNGAARVANARGINAPAAGVGAGWLQRFGNKDAGAGSGNVANSRRSMRSRCTRTSWAVAIIAVVIIAAAGAGVGIYLGTAKKAKAVSGGWQGFCLLMHENLG